MKRNDVSFNYECHRPLTLDKYQRVKEARNKKKIITLSVLLLSFLTSW